MTVNQPHVKQRKGRGSPARKTDPNHDRRCHKPQPKPRGGRKRRSDTSATSGSKLKTIFPTNRLGLVGGRTSIAVASVQPFADDVSTFLEIRDP